MQKPNRTMLIAREIFAHQGLTEFFVKNKDGPAYERHCRDITKQASAQNSDLLFKNYSFYKNKHFVIAKSLLQAAPGLTFKLGVLKFPSFGTLPMLDRVPIGEIVKKIRSIGADIVIEEKNLHDYLGVLQHLSDAVFQHHEKISGKGYPYGVSGDDISAFAKIIAVADSYDSMITQRPMRPAVMAYHAIIKLVTDKEDYDQKIVRALVEVMK